MATVSDLSALLSSRTGFEVLDAQLWESRMRIVGRVPPNASSHWVLVSHHLLDAAESAHWKVDVSRNYFLRSVGDRKKMFYTWRLIFEAGKVADQINSIMSAINAAPKPARFELQEFPLTGTSRNHANGKGAFTAETTPMVAHVAAAAKMGGIRT